MNTAATAATRSRPAEDAAHGLPATAGSSPFRHSQPHCSSPPDPEAAEVASQIPPARQKQDTTPIEGRLPPFRQLRDRSVASRSASAREPGDGRDRTKSVRLGRPRLDVERAVVVGRVKLTGPAKWTPFYLYGILDVFSRYVVDCGPVPRERAAREGHRARVERFGVRRRASTLIPSRRRIPSA